MLAEALAVIAGDYDDGVVVDAGLFQNCNPVGDGGIGVRVDRQPLPSMPVELLGLFDRSELSKYLTEDELVGLPEEKH